MLFNDAFSFYSQKLEPPGLVVREIFLSSLACVVSKAEIKTFIPIEEVFLKIKSIFVYARRYNRTPLSRTAQKNEIRSRYIPGRPA